MSGGGSAEEKQRRLTLSTQTADLQQLGRWESMEMGKLQGQHCNCEVNRNPTDVKSATSRKGDSEITGDTGGESTHKTTGTADIFYLTKSLSRAGEPLQTGMEAGVQFTTQPFNITMGGTLGIIWSTVAKSLGASWEWLAFHALHENPHPALQQCSTNLIPTIYFTGPNGR